MRMRFTEAHACPMSEYVLILYPIVLIGYLLLAAHWQPKGAPHASKHASADAPRGRVQNRR
jgi:hypothetical protein